VFVAFYTKLNVLIIGKSQLSQKLTSTFLKNTEHQITEITSTASDVLLQLKASAIDLVLVHLELCQNSTVEFIKSIQALKAVPIIIISDNEQIKIVPELCECGVMSFLIKPFDLFQFDRAVCIAFSSFKNHKGLKDKTKLPAAKIIKSNALRDQAGVQKCRTINQFEKMQAIGNFAGCVAHDFNNQLGGILGYADLLLNTISNNEKQKKYTEAIISATTKATDLSMKLLTFARKSNVDKPSVHLHEIINSVIMQLNDSIPYNIDICMKFDLFEPVIAGDVSQLQNTFLNIALNAFDAMSNGGTLTFTTTAHILENKHPVCKSFQIAPGNYIQIAIKDTGCGMSEDILKHLYEPFFTTKAGSRGTGLGLATVYSTVTGHSGGIAVDSKPGCGTTFRLFFPMRGY
jgi:nitrogen-specific signal transduction histidine kinase/ActR/RegA family two-component response regulator